MMKVILAGTLLVSALTVQPVLAREQGTLEQCRLIQSRIDHYTDLKRRGGDSQTMARLHKKRNEYKDEFQRLSCRVYRGQLK